MYSLIERTPERELLPMAHALDIGVTGGHLWAEEYYQENTAMPKYRTRIKRNQKDCRLKIRLVHLL
jgi:aryl-alcohol dehydrogenase-like predicted oxidoreductase